MRPVALDSRKAQFTLAFFAVLFIGLAIMGVAVIAARLGLHQPPEGALAAWPATSGLDYLAGVGALIFAVVAGAWAAGARRLRMPIVVCGLFAALWGLPAILHAGQGGIAIFPDRLSVSNPPGRTQVIGFEHLGGVWVGCEVERRYRRRATRPPDIEFG